MLAKLGAANAVGEFIARRDVQPYAFRAKFRRLGFRARARAPVVIGGAGVAAVAAVISCRNFGALRITDRVRGACFWFGLV